MTVKSNVLSLPYFFNIFSIRDDTVQIRYMEREQSLKIVRVFFDA